MSGIVLSASVRQNLLSLQSTADLLATTQNRLATGKKVNTALDNPTNFFTAQSLDSRASDINNLLDGIGNGVQVLQAANTGITSLQKLVDTAKSIANQALQTTAGYSTKSNVSTTIAGATATTCAAPRPLPTLSQPRTFCTPVRPAASPLRGPQTLGGPSALGGTAACHRHRRRWRDHRTRPGSLDHRRRGHGGLTPTACVHRRRRHLYGQRQDDHLLAAVSRRQLHRSWRATAPGGGTVSPTPAATRSSTRHSSGTPSKQRSMTCLTAIDLASGVRRAIPSGSRRSDRRRDRLHRHRRRRPALTHLDRRRSADHRQGRHPCGLDLTAALGGGNVTVGATRLPPLRQPR